MIGVFADPYPDEIDYSIFARTIEILGYPNEYHGMQELFGSASIRPVVGLQSGLDHLLSELPCGAAYSFNELIDNHTLLPLYKPFYPAEYITDVMTGMKDGKLSGLANLLASTVYGIRAHTHLNYCPVCAEDDREQYGEAYWHRLHQIDGVYVCDKHNCWLESSDVELGELRSFITADEVIGDREPGLPDAEDETYEHYLMLARNFRWLLSRNIEYDNELLQRRYRKLLFEQELAIYTGSIRTKQLIKALESHYGSKFLSDAGCDFAGQTKRNWLTRLLERQSTQSPHPIQHVLLINMLGCTCEEFFDLDPKIKPFGDALWPCLSPAVCEHRNQSVIENVHIGISRQMNRRPRGIFCCPNCGYTYTRIGPDKTNNDRHRGKVLNYGHLWDAKLIEIWSDDTSLTAKSSQLGIGIDTLKRQAKRLDLINDKNVSVVESFHVSHIDRLKAKWLAILERDPSKGVAQLIKEYGHVYRELYKCCVDWLLDHSPDKRYANLYQLKDWDSLDASLHSRVAGIAEEIRHYTDPPVRVTINSIGMRLGWQDGSIYKDLAKVPRTKQAIDQVTETAEDFAVRRIKRLAYIFISDGHLPTQAEYIKRAGLSRSMQTSRTMNQLKHQIMNIRRTIGD